MSVQNLTLLTDFYELTMMQGYYKNKNNDVVIFDMFYRDNPCGSGYAICAGLEQVIDYIKNLRFKEDDIEYLRSLKIFDEGFLSYLKDFRFTGDIYAIPEERSYFDGTLNKSHCPHYGGQLVETAILNFVNHQSLIATRHPAWSMRRRHSRHGIRLKKGTGTGCRNPGCQGCGYWRLYRHSNVLSAQAVRYARPRNSRS